MAAAANEAYIKARAQGHGDADFSAVLEAVLAQRGQ
jgi:3-hydroxyisobutyrate dehydrogenase-like beta-hydroxyacid dehydrogenase